MTYSREKFRDVKRTKKSRVFNLIYTSDSGSSGEGAVI
jgi:hypothetical protein